MASTVTMSELDAVNTMLSLIGEAPVNSLIVSGLAEVALAKAILDEANRELQEKGWAFNVESEFLLTRDVNNYIQLPINALRVVLSPRHAPMKVTQRGTRLYNRTDHTYVFTKDLYVEITYLLPFEDLPQAAKHYLTIRAGRKFQRRALGDDNMERYTAEEELTAYSRIEDSDCDVGGYNMLRDNYDSLSIIGRDYLG